MCLNLTKKSAINHLNSLIKINGFKVFPPNKCRPKGVALTTYSVRYGNKYGCRLWVDVDIKNKNLYVFFDYIGFSFSR